MDNEVSHPDDWILPGKKIRVLVMDDHAIVRQGLRMFIEMQADMEVVGEGTNGMRSRGAGSPA